MTAGVKRLKAGRNHYYKIDGVKVDGVTTLLKEGMPKPALVHWASKSVAEHVADNIDAVIGMRDMGRQQIINALKGVPWAQRDAAAVQGTAVHALAEKLSHGEEIEVPDHLAGYVESCVKFLDEWQVEPIRTETTVASRKWSYCGTFDGVFRIAGPRIVMADYKTSRSGIWPETAMQEAAYRWADVWLDDNGDERPMSELGIEEAIAVWLRSDGYDVYTLDTSEKVFKDFLHVAWVARCRTQRMNDWISDAQTAPHLAVSA